MRRLGIDVDGVLANFFVGYENLIVEIAGEDKFPKDTLPPVWNWPEHYGYSKEVVGEAWQRIKKSEDFWINLPALPGADTFLQRLVESDHEIYFVTDRPGKDPQYQTIKWLENGDYYFASVIVTAGAPKSEIANALRLDTFIDDKPENILDLGENFFGKTFHLVYPYNDHIKYPGVTRVANLEVFWKEASL